MPLVPPVCGVVLLVLTAPGLVCGRPPRCGSFATSEDSPSLVERQRLIPRAVCLCTPCRLLKRYVCGRECSKALVFRIHHPHVLGLQRVLEVVTVNVKTCEVTHTNQTLSNGHQLSTLAFDASTGLVYGLGIEPAQSPKSRASAPRAKSPQASWVRTLVTFDAVDRTFSLVGAVPGFLLMEGVEATLDPQHRTMFVPLACVSCGLVMRGWC